MLASLNWPTSWDRLKEQALAPVTVAVLDSGVDGSHPDLAGRICGAFAVEVEDEPVVRERSPTANNDLFGHGTPVAGIIAAIAPNAQIYDLRVFSDKKVSATQILLTGFEHALDQPWRLLNMSLAVVPSIRAQMIDLCERAYFQQQIVIAARRNAPFDDDGLPAELSSCIGVDRGDYPSPFQYTFRPHTPVEFEARGESVVAPAKGGGYTTLSGTSFATPTVSGLCALLLGAYPDMTLFELKTSLRQLAQSAKNDGAGVK
jgi:subtilisin